jgi:very-short-patch-repair endonuclease
VGKSHLEALLAAQIEQAGLPEPEREFMFAKRIGRRWRLDFAWPDLKIAVEVDGGNWVYGRHNRAKGAHGDRDKFNEAVRMGWRVLHFDDIHLNEDKALAILQDVLDQGRRNKPEPGSRKKRR